jgi:glycosyltransferase involved in cell wall biosynthesis
MKVLVLVQDYPRLDGTVKLMYVHSRNLFYKDNGIDVEVLNFSSDSCYKIDGIKVITFNDYTDSSKEYDILISHAPNLRNHYRFLKRYGHRFKNYVFFFHGHEVLKINESYSKPYEYVKKSKVKDFIQDIYDEIKLKVWNRYFVSVIDKSNFVFVSQWMLDQFLKWTRIPYEKIRHKSSITYNCIGKKFEEYKYDSKTEKIYDFLTVRNNLDGSKYSIDLVNSLAENNPDYKFLLVGKGEFFQHYRKAENLLWLEENLNHTQIVYYLSMSRCALMPTRTDAQGLMMCEMASTGIPLITSDIDVCHEVFEGFSNVGFISNEDYKLELKPVLESLQNGLPYKINDRYYNKNTSKIEVDLLNSLFRQD